MSFVTVYDKEGTPHFKQPVDARECVEILGFSYEKPSVQITESESHVTEKRGRKQKQSEDKG